MLIVQSSTNPAAVRHAMMDCISQSLSGFQIASAYMTLGGCKIFEDCCLRNVSRESYHAAEKHVITSLDYGITHPDALRYWLGVPNTVLRIAGSELIREGKLRAPRSSYHPKYYSFQFTDSPPNSIVGSANLTSRGLTINAEAVWVQKAIEQSLNEVWATLEGNTVTATSDLIDLYQEARTHMPPQQVAIEAEPVIRERLPVADENQLPVFSEAVASGELQPELFNEMWVQVEQLQGGSKNQLELPRGAHRFFGFQFNDYDLGNVERIGSPILVSGRYAWDDRPLTWHGDNRMERINLPTLAKGGFEYGDSAIMFRRLGDGAIELVVVPWDSDVAAAWVNASIEQRRLYKLGARTTRLSGFIAPR